MRTFTMTLGDAPLSASGKTMRRIRMIFGELLALTGGPSTHPLELECQLRVHYGAAWPAFFCLHEDYDRVRALFAQCDAAHAVTVFRDGMIEASLRFTGGDLAEDRLLRFRVDTETSRVTEYVLG